MADFLLSTVSATLGRLPAVPDDVPSMPEAIRASVDQTRPGLPARIVHYAKTKIAVMKGPDAGLTVEIAGSTVRVGTSPDNDLVLTDDTVSRRHCGDRPRRGRNPRARRAIDQRPVRRWH